MITLPQTLCIGSALWDIVARAHDPLVPGGDVPGRITRQMGGVALNVALALAARDVTVGVLSALGRDAEGDALTTEMQTAGIDCSFLCHHDQPTDVYLAVENADGELFSAVADCHALEAVGARVLEPLTTALESGFTGQVIVDGNLPTDVLKDLHRDTGEKAELIFVPASPGKARRLADVLDGATLFANRVEAELICERNFLDSREAALALRDKGAGAIITDSQQPATLARGDVVASVTPPVVEITSVTGAGDAFLAGFIAAELAGNADEACLQVAVDTAAAHISRKLS